MSNDDRGYIPQWGELPVEQYMIRYWDFVAAESPDQQRLLLIRQFIDLDEIPRE
ncbi:hypothetical protein N7499_008144 [Penicillium canescens]|uniref:Uncharacterized protein n=1 Tax=Penicillium canescens TaxID=5083 RepID=A0AAD6N1Z3_PENCN|nr:uncharacterized protein N7446_013177 [Penicillium canescens]KAJ6022825.1 hypothetical protein N7460_013220 [Penicillium canescens]KAJ6025911.1 hypothetical protein N7444_013590 [Penicillium canescens]KAJ6042111.1 hypothetical protein N7446_013177 [Penicillium canescens]KAJ6076163.1 hypothetical protein N7499_008144 [Penicillium canescens]KAJ6158474.1 hypothetical protein N7485_011300 [Penicillium canescens]